MIVEGCNSEGVVVGVSSFTLGPSPRRWVEDLWFGRSSCELLESILGIPILLDDLPWYWIRGAFLLIQVTKVCELPRGSSSNSWIFNRVTF